MHSAEGRANTRPGSTPLSLWWALTLGAAGTSLVALTVAAQIYMSMLHHGHSFVRIAVWQLCSWSVWAAATPVVLQLGGQLTNRSARSPKETLRVIATGLLILGAHMLLASVATVWLQPYIPVERFRFGAALILQVISVPVDLLVYGLLLVIGAGLAVYQRAQNLEVRESHLEADLARAQLDALRLEIEPHFLFNSLNSIAALIRTQASDRALSMLLELSELLRAAVDGRRQHTTTLAEETAFVRRYIELQRTRFSDRLAVRYAISPESERCAVPAFLLQPVVENAFRHGFARRSGSCHLELAASVDGSHLNVSVRDDGAGLPPDFDLTEHSGTGLGNARLRLQRLYDGAAQIRLERADGGGTIAHIRLPVHETNVQYSART
jgi:two-component system, LytTR family, sensor kinase